MKKIIFLVLMNCLLLQVNSQSISLKLSNPAPRVGETFSIQYKINIDDTPLVKGILKTDIDAPIGNNACKANYYLAKGSLYFNKAFEEEGPVSLGPLSFKIEAKEFTSDTISLTIYPKLPNVRTGVWVRVLTYNSTNYIILDQRISSIKKSNQTDLDEQAFIEINESKLIGSKLKIVSKRRQSGTYFIDGEINRSEREYKYRTTIYIVSADSDYKNDFTLSQECFINVPENSDIKPALVDFK